MGRRGSLTVSRRPPPAIQSTEWTSDTWRTCGIAQVSLTKRPFSRQSRTPSARFPQPRPKAASASVFSRLPQEPQAETRPVDWRKLRMLTAFSPTTVKYLASMRPIRTRRPRQKSDFWGRIWLSFRSGRGIIRWWPRGYLGLSVRITRRRNLADALSLTQIRQRGETSKTRLTPPEMPFSHSYSQTAKVKSITKTMQRGKSKICWAKSKKACRWHSRRKETCFTKREDTWMRQTRQISGPKASSARYFRRWTENLRKVTSKCSPSMAPTLWSTDRKDWQTRSDRHGRAKSRRSAKLSARPRTVRKMQGACGCHTTIEPVKWAYSLPVIKQEPIMRHLSFSKPRWTPTRCWVITRPWSMSDS